MGEKEEGDGEGRERRGGGRRGRRGGEHGGVAGGQEHPQDHALQASAAGFVFFPTFPLLIFAIQNRLAVLGFCIPLLTRGLDRLSAD